MTGGGWLTVAIAHGDPECQDDLDRLRALSRFVRAAFHRGELAFLRTRGGGDWAAYDVAFLRTRGGGDWTAYDLAGPHARVVFEELQVLAKDSDPGWWSLTSSTDGAGTLTPWPLLAWPT